MLGAPLGDIIGSRFEFNNHRSTDFALFTPFNDYTDDTICTAAIADWLLNNRQSDLAQTLQNWCKRYPNPTGAYGARFYHWIQSDHPQPYNSWGNGAPMRVSAAGWVFHTLPKTLAVAEQTAAITHNHPEGIKGAQATAVAIFLARQGADKPQIRDHIAQTYGYNLNQTCDQIRPKYQFDESSQGTVPQAIIAFLDSQDFEHAIRLAISLGGDSDTLAAITGSIAEAFYGIPQTLREHALAILPRDIAEVLLAFEQKFQAA